MIELKNVSKTYQDKLALENISYNFKPGKTYGILGINGAGKSTLLGCLTKNLAHTGSVNYIDLQASDIGYVPQELAIYPDLSVLDNLMFFAASFRLPKAQAKQNALELIEHTGLSEKSDALVKTLSGGMKRKLNLITGLVHQPKYLICDEVCVGIDVLARKEILDYLKSLQFQGLTLIYTSHYLDEVEYLCEEILFLHEGQLILSGKTSELAERITGRKDAHLEEIFEQLLRKGGE